LNNQLDAVSDAGCRSSGWFIIQTQIISSWNLLPAAGLAIPALFWCRHEICVAHDLSGKDSLQMMMKIYRSLCISLVCNLLLGPTWR